VATHHHVDPRAEQDDESLAVTSPEGKRLLRAIHRVEGTILRMGQQVTRMASDVAKLKAGAVEEREHDKRSIPPGVKVEDVTDESPSGLHRVVNESKWSRMQVRARRMAWLERASGVVAIAVVSAFAVVGAFLAAASLYDAAVRHPHLVEHASHE
jgi:hypothetical protein